MAETRWQQRQVIEPLESRYLLSGVGDSYTPPGDPRLSLDLDASWKFLRSDSAGAANVGFDDSSWSTVSVPHSWNTLDGQDGGSNYYRGIGWYRKTITVPASFSGKSIYLQFEGSSLVTDVYVDGTSIGEHRGAFGAFNFDVTSVLTPAVQHLIAVKVDNSSSWASILPPQSGDFNVNGGIYRKVSLVGADKAHVNLADYASSGVYFASPTVSPSSASIQVRSGVINSDSSSRTLLIRSVLADGSGTIVAQVENTQSLSAGQLISLTQNSTVTNPHLWNGRLDPYLHDLYVEIRDAGTNQLLDLVHQRVGIRSYQISPTQGFILNGQPYDLHGVNMHQDRLGEAWAISDDNIREDIGLVMEIGATMLRTAHYEQSQLVYDLADEDGLVVWAEVPDCGSGNGGAIPTGSTFATNTQEQLKELIRQNYNHASIVVWSVYNEVSDTSANDAFVTTLSNLAHSEDPNRPTVGASWDGSVGNLEKITNAVAYNRYYGWYYGVPGDLATQLDSMHSANPGVAIGMSEYGAGAGITQHQESPTSVTASSLWHPEEYQTYLHEQSWKILEARPWLWTKLIWNMFDFAVDGRNEGDTPGRNDKGLVTYDRQTKKDSFWFYKANWSADPVLYITSRRWTERSAATTSVKMYSNVDNPVVTINGVSQGALVDQGDHVWLLSNVTLSPGNNTVVVSGTRGGQAYSDTVVWHLTVAPTPGTGQIKINFQPADSGPTAAGYLIDSGLAFGDRGNGLAYGWNIDNTANTRRRSVNADVRYDTIIHMQRNGTFTWEYALANGTYDVNIFAGDPSFTDSLHSFNVEGVALTDSDGQDNFDSYGARVTVADGRLTIAPIGTNAKLDFVEITAVDTTPPNAISGQFLYETGHSLSFAFDEPMDVLNFNPSDVVAELQPGGATYTPASVAYTPGSKTATFTFSAPLPNGNFIARLKAGSVSDLAGNTLPHDYTFPLFALAADANRNRKVDATDLGILSLNWQQIGRTFSQGNFDYSPDGKIDVNDLAILAAHWQQSLAAPVVSPAPPAFRVPGKRVVDRIADQVNGSEPITP